MNNEELKNILGQIKIWLMVIAALLLVNVIVLVVVNGDNNSTTNSTTNEEETDLEYDVSEFEQVSKDDIFNRVKESGYHVVYIGRSTCGYCTKFLPIMKEAQNQLGFKTWYLDITEIIDFVNEKIIDQDAYDKLIAYNEKFGATPMVLVFKDGEYVDGFVGYTDLDTYVGFLNNAGIK